MSCALQRNLTFAVCCLGFTTSYGMLQALKGMVSQDPAVQAAARVRRPTTCDDLVSFQQQLDRLSDFKPVTFVRIFDARQALKNKVEPAIRCVAHQIIDEQRRGKICNTKMLYTGTVYCMLSVLLLWGSYHGITDLALCDQYSFFMPASCCALGIGAGQTGLQEYKNGLLYTEYLLQRAARNKQFVDVLMQKYADLDAEEKKLEDGFRTIKSSTSLDTH